MFNVEEVCDCIQRLNPTSSLEACRLIEEMISRINQSDNKNISQRQATVEHVHVVIESLETLLPPVTIPQFDHQIDMSAPGHNGDVFERPLKTAREANKDVENTVTGKCFVPALKVYRILIKDVSYRVLFGNDIQLRISLRPSYDNDMFIFINDWQVIKDKLCVE